MSIHWKILDLSTLSDLHCTWHCAFFCLRFAYLRGPVLADARSITSKLAGPVAQLDRATAF